MSLTIALSPLLALIVTSSPCSENDRCTGSPPIVVYAEETPATRQVRLAKALHRQRVAVAELTRAHRTASTLRIEAEPARIESPPLILVRPSEIELALELGAPMRAVPSRIAAAAVAHAHPPPVQPGR